MLLYGGGRAASWSSVHLRTSGLSVCCTLLYSQGEGGQGYLGFVNLMINVEEVASDLWKSDVEQVYQ